MLTGPALPFTQGALPRPRLRQYPGVPPRIGSAENPRAQEVKGAGAAGIPWAPEGSCSGGKQIPLWLWGTWAPWAVQLSSTRVVNRSRRVGGSSRDPEPQPGTKGGQRRQRKVKGEVRRSRRRKERERELREKRKGEQREGTGQRGGEGRVRGLESGHGGSLGASRFFTNEGSKKEKRGLKGQADSLLGKRPRKELNSFPSPTGEHQEWGSICPEKRCQLRAHPLQ